MLEVAVVGRPDDVLGEVVLAYVALRPRPCTVEVLRSCAASGSPTSRARCW